MNKCCARCEKTVYPTEELKCLDKVWHKGCFKCQECGMTLSMKTYKGFNKLPYCEAHIPKAKATAVAETPEMKRLAENTKIQSNVQYHAEFEKNKAKFTQVADDPETRRIKQNTKIISNVSYHGDMERKAIMELKRSDPAGENEKEPNDLPTRDNQNYQHHHHQQPPPPSQQPIKVPQSMPSPVSSQQYRGSMPASGQTTSYAPPSQNIAAPPSQNIVAPPPQYYHSSQQPPSQPYHQYQHSSHPHYQSSQPNSSHSTGLHSGGGYNSHHHPQVQSQHPHQAQHYQKMHSSHAPNIHNAYQDANHNSPYSARTSQTLIYSSQTGPVQQPTSSRRIGSIVDYDPVNDQYGSLAPNRGGHSHSYRQDPGYPANSTTLYGDNVGNSHVQQQQHNPQPMQQKITAPPTQLGRCYRALYDYEAADTDEVSFKDGDLIINCTSIDEGWMTGTVQRSNRTGMLPANYVERVS